MLKNCLNFILTFYKDENENLKQLRYCQLCIKQLILFNYLT